MIDIPKPPIAARPGSAMRPRAKLFRNGRSQAVRLPKEFRLPGVEVFIHRDGPRIVLEPVADSGLPLGFWDDIDRLGAGADFPDVEPLSGQLLDLSKTDQA